MNKKSIQIPKKKKNTPYTWMNNKNIKRERKSVAFQSAEIVEFEPTIYTTSVSSGGIPMGLSFKERRRCRRRLDSFEEERKNKRIDRQIFMEEGYLTPEERQCIFENTGHLIKAMNQVQNEVTRINTQRVESIELDSYCNSFMNRSLIYDSEEENESCGGNETSDDAPSDQSDYLEFTMDPESQINIESTFVCGTESEVDL